MSAQIAQGFGDGELRPRGIATRQAFMVFLARTGPAALAPSGPPTFTDVSEDHPFFVEIEQMAELGVTAGFSDGSFRPDVPLTRQAAMAFLARFNGAELPVFGPPTFTDVPEGHPFFSEIEASAAVGFTTGFSDGSFRPDHPATREAAIAFVYRQQILSGESSWTTEARSYLALERTTAGEATSLLDYDIGLGLHQGQFAAGRSCASFFGAYRAPHERFELVGPTMTHPVACEAPEPPYDMQWYSDLLHSSPLMVVDGDSLTLSSDDTTVRFVRVAIPDGIYNPDP